MKKWINKYNNLPIQAKASLWFLLCSFLQKGIAIISTPIFTRLMTTSEYGKFNVFLSWQSIVTALVILTLPWGVVEQGLIKFTDKRNEFTSASLGLMTTLLLLWFCVYLSATSFWNKLLSLTTMQMVGLFSIIWTSSVFTFWSINQRIIYKYKKLVFLTMVVSILKPLVGVVLVTCFLDKVTMRIMSLVGVEVVFFFGLFVSMMNKGRIFFSKEIWIYVLSFNLPLIPHYLSQCVLNNSDRIMIEQLCGSNEAGIYSLAYSLSMVMLIVNSSIQSAVSPWFFQKIKDNKLQDLKIVVYPSMMIVAFMNLLLIAFAPEAVRFFAPAEYYDAIWIIPPVAMSVYFILLYGFFANIEFYYEKTHMMSLATMIGAVLNIVLNFVFIRIFGYYAAGYTTLVCYIVYALCHYAFVRYICLLQLGSFDFFSTRVLLSITLGFITFGFLISLTYNHFLLRYVVILVLTSIFLVKYREIVLLFKQIRKTDS